MYIARWIGGTYDYIRNCVGRTYAITTTNFIELNTKRGQQFYLNEKYTGFVAGSTKEYLFQVGPEPAILKSRIIKTNAVDVDYEVIVNTGGITVTDPGTPITIYNANGTSTNTLNSSVFENPTYTGTGVLNERDWIPGEQGGGNRSVGAFDINGFEKIIPGNSEIITRFTNNGTVDGTLFYYLTVYQGPIKPLNDEEL